MGKDDWKTKEWLTKEYLDNQKSIHTIAKEVKTSDGTVVNYLKRFGITRRAKGFPLKESQPEPVTQPVEAPPQPLKAESVENLPPIIETPIEVETQPAVAVVATVADPPKIPEKKKGVFNWWFVLVGLFLIVGIVSAIKYVTVTQSTGSPPMTYVFVLLICFALGGISLMMAYRTATKGAGISVKAPSTGLINAFVIYGKMVDAWPKADRVEFEHRPENELLGDRWYFQDVGKWLHVMFTDLEKGGELAPFMLGDTEYIAPTTLRVPLNLSRTDEYLQQELGLYEKLKPVIVAVVFCIVILFAWLAGQPPTGG